MKKEDLKVGMQIKHPLWNDVETVIMHNGKLALEWGSGKYKQTIDVDDINPQYPLKDYILVSMPENPKEEKPEEKEIRCAYCGKILDANTISYDIVWVNHNAKRLPFCKNTNCAGYFQMGAEG